MTSSRGIAMTLRKKQSIQQSLVALCVSATLHLLQHGFGCACENSPVIQHLNIWKGRPIIC
jgi:hypothetical protein